MNSQDIKNFIFPSIYRVFTCSEWEVTGLISRNIKKFEVFMCLLLSLLISSCNTSLIGGSKLINKIIIAEYMT